jgi:ABC-2 type transport system permease protein
MYLYTILSLVMLVLSFFKAGSVLFSMKFYDIIISLPVTKSALLVSRFVTMYVTNLLFSLIVLVPGLAVHIFFAKPGFGFYLISLFVILFAPLLPLTLASIIGAGIKAISSRMKRRNLVEVLLCMVLVIIPIVFGTKMGETTENMDPEAIKEMVGALTDMLGRIFPPALWYHNALQGDFLSLLLLLLVPTLVFALFIAIFGRFHQRICIKLNAVAAKQNYKIGSLEATNLLWSLCKKEAKMYFSSSLYVTNSSAGYIMAVILAGGIGIAGIDSFTEALEMPMLAPVITQFLPFILAMPFCMMNLTSCSISLEGKCYWQFQVLPIRSKDVYDAKLLWNLIVAAPFYLVSVVLLLVFVKPAGLLALHYILLPLLYIVADVVLGLFANLRFPLFHWENETRVVKQSASVAVAMLGGVLLIIIPAVLGIVLQPSNFNLYLFAVEAALVAVTAALYTIITGKELINA